MKIFKRVILFILFELVFCSALGIILVFHGPFINIKENFVTSAMSTMKHQYLARLFVSQAEIDRIMNESKSSITTESENQDDVKISTTNSNVQINEIKSSRFKGYLMVIGDPGSVKVGTAENLGHGGMTVSQIVKRYDADGGINAGGFGDNYGISTGGVPEGIIIENYEIKYKDSSGAFQVIGFNDKNVLITGSFSLEQIKAMKIRDAVSFGPSIVVNGKPMISKGNGGKGLHPRTAIGQRKDGTVLFLVIDGRQTDSIGATLKDVQDIMLENGAYNAANLDGGASTTMYYNSKLVNKPSDILGERAVPTAFIIGEKKVNLW